MKSFKIEIEIYDVGGVYSAEDLDKAKEIAQQECDLIYNKLNGRCSEEVKSVEEIKE